MEHQAVGETQFFIREVHDESNSTADAQQPLIPTFCFDADAVPLYAI